MYLTYICFFICICEFVTSNNAELFEHVVKGQGQIEKDGPLEKRSADVSSSNISDPLSKSCLGIFCKLTRVINAQNSTLLPSAFAKNEAYHSKRLVEPIEHPYLSNKEKVEKENSYTEETELYLNPSKPELSPQKYNLTERKDNLEIDEIPYYDGNVGRNLNPSHPRSFPLKESDNENYNENTEGYLNPSHARLAATTDDYEIFIPDDRNHDRFVNAPHHRDSSLKHDLVGEGDEIENYDYTESYFQPTPARLAFHKHNEGPPGEEDIYNGFTDGHINPVHPSFAHHKSIAGYENETLTHDRSDALPNDNFGAEAEVENYDVDTEHYLEPTQPRLAYPSYKIRDGNDVIGPVKKKQDHYLNFSQPRFAIPKYNLGRAQQIGHSADMGNHVHPLEPRTPPSQHNIRKESKILRSDHGNNAQNFNISHPRFAIQKRKLGVGEVEYSGNTKQYVSPSSSTLIKSINNRHTETKSPKINTEIYTPHFKPTSVFPKYYPDNGEDVSKPHRLRGNNARYLNLSHPRFPPPKYNLGGVEEIENVNLRTEWYLEPTHPTFTSPKYDRFEKNQMGSYKPHGNHLYHSRSRVSSPKPNLEAEEGKRSYKEYSEVHLSTSNPRFRTSKFNVDDDNDILPKPVVRNGTRYLKIPQFKFVVTSKFGGDIQIHYNENTAQYIKSSPPKFPPPIDDPVAETERNNYNTNTEKKVNAFHEEVRKHNKAHSKHNAVAPDNVANNNGITKSHLRPSRPRIESPKFNIVEEKLSGPYSGANDRLLNRSQERFPAPKHNLRPTGKHMDNDENAERYLNPEFASPKSIIGEAEETEDYDGNSKRYWNHSPPSHATPNYNLVEGKETSVPSEKNNVHYLNYAESSGAPEYNPDEYEENADYNWNTESFHPIISMEYDTESPERAENYDEQTDRYLYSNPSFISEPRTTPSKYYLEPRGERNRNMERHQPGIYFQKHDFGPMKDRTYIEYPDYHHVNGHRRKIVKHKFGSPIESNNHNINTESFSHSLKSRVFPPKHVSFTENEIKSFHPKFNGITKHYNSEESTYGTEDEDVYTKYVYNMVTLPMENKHIVLQKRTSISPNSRIFAKDNTKKVPIIVHRIRGTFAVKSLPKSRDEETDIGLDPSLTNNKLIENEQDPDLGYEDLIAHQKVVRLPLNKSFTGNFSNRNSDITFLGKNNSGDPNINQYGGEIGASNESEPLDAPRFYDYVEREVENDEDYVVTTDSDIIIVSHDFNLGGFGEDDTPSELPGIPGFPGDSVPSIDAHPPTQEVPTQEVPSYVTPPPSQAIPITPFIPMPLTTSTISPDTITGNGTNITGNKTKKHYPNPYKHGSIYLYYSCDNIMSKTKCVHQFGSLLLLCVTNLVFMLGNIVT